jgi:hypothetical protein
MARPTRGETNPEVRKPMESAPTIHERGQPVSAAIGVAMTARR